MDYINRIVCGDARELIKELPDESVDCVITSPPYWGLFLLTIHNMDSIL